jgi:pyridoxine kinase
MPRPAVIVVTSHVARGSVGGRASVFTLERMGFPVWSLPTVTLSWHPGHGAPARLAADPKGFGAIAAGLEGSRFLPEVGGVLSGYFDTVEQIEATAVLVKAVKKANPRTIFLCDPVIGDSGGLFRAEGIAAAIRDRLLPLADIATPNRHELAWLTGTQPLGTGTLVSAVRRLGPKEVVVTSAFAPEGDIGTLLVAPNDVHLATHAELPNAPHGTGDVLAALYLARRLDGLPPAAALERAVAAVFRLVKLAAESGANELPLAAGQDALRAEPSGVVMTKL